MNPISKPVVNTSFGQMSGLQRATECFRYTVLCVEHWISPEGNVREWVRKNLLLGVRLIIPAIFIMPVIGFILWQMNGWLSMLTGIFGRLIDLPLLILVVLVVLRTIRR